jgi:hypothetical protein
MNTTLRNILNSAFAILSMIAIFAFLLLTHPIVVTMITDEIIPVH